MNQLTVNAFIARLFGAHIRFVNGRRTGGDRRLGKARETVCAVGTAVAQEKKSRPSSNTNTSDNNNATCNGVCIYNVYISRRRRKTMTIVQKTKQPSSLSIISTHSVGGGHSGDE